MKKAFSFAKTGVTAASLYSNRFNHPSFYGMMRPKRTTVQLSTYQSRNMSTMAINCAQFHKDDVITGQVKVEYAFETVRVRIYLPQWGETWFFIDKNTTLEDFLDQVNKEDKFLTNVAIMEFKNGQKESCTHDPKTTKIYDLLTSHEKSIHYL